MAGVKNYAGVTNDLDVATKKYVDDGLSEKASQDDMDDVEEGLDEILDSNDQEIYDSNDQEVLKTETWTFILDGGTQVIKSVFVRA